jgi:hypothetical protein
MQLFSWSDITFSSVMQQSNIIAHSIAHKKSNVSYSEARATSNYEEKQKVTAIDGNKIIMHESAL